MYKPNDSTSRREFVKDFALTSGALAFGLSLRPTASADETSTTDRATKLDLQVVPSPYESTGVIFEAARATYLIFKATQIDDRDREAQGTAVIELVGCCSLATAYPGDDLFPQPGRPRYFGELDFAAVYELENSAWLAALDAKCRQMRPIEKHNTKVPLKKIARSGKVTFSYKPMTVNVTNIAYRPPSEDARHFAFSFRNTTFHCVADDLKIDFLTAPLGLVLASLSAPDGRAANQVA